MAKVDNKEAKKPTKSKTVDLSKVSQSTEKVVITFNGKKQEVSKNVKEILEAKGLLK